MSYKLTDPHMFDSFSHHVIHHLALTGMVLFVVLIVGCRGGGGGGGGSASVSANGASQLYVSGNSRSTLLSGLRAVHGCGGLVLWGESPTAAGNHYPPLIDGLR